MKDSMKKRDVQQVHRQRTRLATRFFIFKTLDRPQNESRIAFAFSRKIGNAVLRNTYKRRFRELLRDSSPGGRDVLCIAKQSLSNLSAQAWQKEKQKIREWLENLQSHRHPSA